MLKYIMYVFGLMSSTPRNAVAFSFVNRCFSVEWAGNEKCTGKQFERILRLAFFPVHICWAPVDKSQCWKDLMSSVPSSRNCCL